MYIAVDLIWFNVRDILTKAKSEASIAKKSVPAGQQSFAAERIEVVKNIGAQSFIIHFSQWKSINAKVATLNIYRKITHTLIHTHIHTKK